MLEIRPRDLRAIAIVTGLNTVALLALGLYLHGASQLLLCLGFALAARRLGRTPAKADGE